MPNILYRASVRTESLSFLCIQESNVDPMPWQKAFFTGVSGCPLNVLGLTEVAIETVSLRKGRQAPHGE